MQRSKDDLPDELLVQESLELLNKVRALGDPFLCYLFEVANQALLEKLYTDQVPMSEYPPRLRSGRRA